MRAIPRDLRTAITVALLAFVVLSVGYVILTRVIRPTAAARPAGEMDTTARAQTVVYYFHTSARCASCLRIEAWTKECLEKEFAFELKSGLLSWKPVDLEADGNIHFVEDFKLTAKTVVVCNYRDGMAGEYADLVDIWQFLGDKGRFFLLVRAKVKEYLGRTS
jgi:uncharacterized membrane protein